MLAVIRHCLFFTERCDTEGGDPCIFPFDYDGKKYYSCTWASAFTKERNGTPWCATKTTSFPWKVIKWGDCTEGCPIEIEGMIRMMSGDIALTDISKATLTSLEGYLNLTSLK